MIKNVVLLGAGNLATQLGQALFDSGINIVQVYSRTNKSASLLAGKINASFTSNLAAIKEHADLYIVAVKDDAFESVVSSVNFGNSLLVHTAGSVSMDILSSFSDNYGVFYPFQTFSKEKKVDFTKVPICLEANDQFNYQQLEDLAQKISYKVFSLDSRQRQVLHIAAILSCNFVNHLYALSDQLLKDNEMSFNMLFPLIRETTEKAMKISPAKAQTGPAMRNDTKIVKKHLDLLENQAEIHKIYQLLTDSIHTLHRNK